MNTTRLHCSEQKALQQFAVEELVDFVHVGRGRRRCATSIYTNPSHRQSPRVSIQRSITKYISTVLRSKKFLSTKNTPMRMTQPATHRPHTITDKHMNNCHMCNFYTIQVINIPGCQLSLLRQLFSKSLLILLMGWSFFLSQRGSEKHSWKETIRRNNCYDFCLN